MQNAKEIRQKKNTDLIKRRKILMREHIISCVYFYKLFTAVIRIEEFKNNNNFDLLDITGHLSSRYYFQ